MCASASRAGRATAASSSPTQVDSDVVRRQLSSGEHIEWVGKPDPAKRFTREDRLLVPFSILWGGFAIVWESLAIGGGGGLFPVFGLPFVAIGLYFIFGRFIYKANRKRRTTYAVTDRRVLSVVAGRGGESVEAAYLDTLTNISTSIDADGSGTIEFGPRTRYANTGMEFLGRGSLGGGGLAFYDIADTRSVADLVARLRDNRAG